MDGRAKRWEICGVLRTIHGQETGVILDLESGLIIGDLTVVACGVDWEGAGARQGDFEAIRGGGMQQDPRCIGSLVVRVVLDPDQNVLHFSRSPFVDSVFRRYGPKLM